MNGILQGFENVGEGVTCMTGGIWKMRAFKFALRKSRHKNSAFRYFNWTSHTLCSYSGRNVMSDSVFFLPFHMSPPPIPAFSQGKLYCTHLPNASCHTSYTFAHVPNRSTAFVKYLLHQIIEGLTLENFTPI